MAFGSPESLRWPSVGKYKVDVASFESLALPELQVSLISPEGLCIACDKYFVYAFFFFALVADCMSENEKGCEEVTIILERDVKKTRPHGYPRVILATRRVWGEDLPPRVMGMGILNIRILNGAGAGITIPIPADTRYKITILPLNY